MRRKQKIFSNEFILQTYTVEKFRFTFSLGFTFCKNRNDSLASKFIYIYIYYIYIYIIKNSASGGFSREISNVVH